MFIIVHKSYLSVVCMLKINHERDVHCALIFLGLFVRMQIVAPWQTVNMYSMALVCDSYAIGWDRKE
jgi:hypothetical protein